MLNLKIETRSRPIWRYQPSWYSSENTELKEITNHQCLGFEVLTAVVMNATIFWDKTSCSPYVNRRFKGKYLVQLPTKSTNFCDVPNSYSRTRLRGLVSLWQKSVPEAEKCFWGVEHGRCVGLTTRRHLWADFQDNLGFSISHNPTPVGIVLLLLTPVTWPPLWSSDQNSWLQIKRSRVRFSALPHFLRSSGSGTGSTQDSWVQLRSYLEQNIAAPV
jgi:hypothetical protein